MYCLAIIHDVTDRQTDRQTDDSMMPIGNHTACSTPTADHAALSAKKQSTGMIPRHTLNNLVQKLVQASLLIQVLEHVSCYLGQFFIAEVYCTKKNVALFHIRTCIKLHQNLR